MQVVYFIDTIDNTLTKIPIRKFERYVRSKNKQDLIKAFKSKWEYVRFCQETLTEYFAFGNSFFVAYVELLKNTEVLYLLHNKYRQ